MDNILITHFKRYADLNRITKVYLLTNILYVATTAISFFFSYYFVMQLHLSVFQAGLLMSCYGVGIFLAITAYPRLNKHYAHDKMILFSLLINAIVFANFLYFTTVALLSVNLILLGFSNHLFKINNNHFLQTHCQNNSDAQKKLFHQFYKASNLGLGLAMVAIAIFATNNVKTLFIIALALNTLPLFYLPSSSFINDSQSLVTTKARSNFLRLSFCLSLLFLGGLILAQLVTTYTIYLALQYPHLGLRAMAIFMLIYLTVVYFLQNPLLTVFHRSNKLLLAGWGALLIGLSSYSMSLAHAFSLVAFSAAILGLGEILFIGNLQRLCEQYTEGNRNPSGTSFFHATLTFSLIVGAALGGYIYQTLSATYLWQSCAYIGIACFVLALGRVVLLKTRPKVQPQI